MGRGCKSVICVGNDKVDVVVGKWEGECLGVVRGIRHGHAEFGCIFYREKNIRDVKTSSEVPFYAGLVKEIIKFFKSGNPPISLEETEEIISFIEAANLSKKQGGLEVKI